MTRTKLGRKKSSVKNKKSSTLASSEAPASSSSNEDLRALLSKEYDSHDHFLKEFDIYYNNKIQNIQSGYEKACEHVKQMINDTIHELPNSVRCDGSVVKLQDSSDDQNKNPNSMSAKEKRQSRSVEQFEFKKPKAIKPTGRSSSRKRSLSASTISGRPADGFKTPLMNTRKLQAGATITPKIFSDTPMNVMRRPQHGEVAVSLSGSPLYISAVPNEDIPTVNVPLDDGRVFSIMPQEGAPPPDLPNFDNKTRNYLKTLRAHLEFLAPNTP